MNEEQYRKVATNSGSAVIVVGMLYFFFLTDAASDLSFELKVIGALICISASLICLRIFFREKK